ncbi:MAG: sulfurtransferase TusA family protein, partial [Candidatus Marinamargulisbacteria bacterium]
FHSARMLLVTRGLDAKTDEQAYQYFDKHFITTGLVSEDFRPLIALGLAKDVSAIYAQKDHVFALADAVNDLYANMDDSLRFKSPTGDVLSDAVPDNAAVLTKDFRGVACPMNFVKTKLVLETLSSGDQLTILLDDGAPIQNVPNSVALEGHQIVSKTQTDGYWTVQIKKA